MKKQVGRSMIEMLGVLAIIGVLSISGIALYRRAVNNHQANSILDDANRLAFVITERGNFAPNDNIEGVEFNQTSTYSIVPFVGQKSGQYGIMVENVPKGVCEPLVDKASVEYKVRVMPYNSTEYIDQIATTGLVYDSFHKDICVNDMNDVVLFFGDTSAQCNKPDEGETYAKCNSNAECCSGSFCWYSNDSPCSIQAGQCKLVNAFNPKTETMDDGNTWTRAGVPMSCWSTRNWCVAQGKSTVSRSDIKCNEVARNEKCTESSTLQSISRKWGGYGFHWLDEFIDPEYPHACKAWGVYFYSYALNHFTKTTDNAYALCR